MVDCREDAIPEGWKLWLDPRVPPELTKFAMGVRDRINQYAYGSIAETVTLPDGRTVGAHKSHHTWTYKKQPDGSTKLVTGICIPGVSLVTRTTGAASMAGEPAFGDDVFGAEAHLISMPHPDAVRFLVKQTPHFLVQAGGALAGGAAGVWLGGPLGGLIGLAGGFIASRKISGKV
jgi:hypothetical protein